ncbi:DUF805 domain-containing protein [Arthrobacter sp. NicSoilB8]|uniref:DUF805 domain-containing protein n=1 Tax=Arthrobacter sp. NicSoilB8 TaxID=2830998 RepID=UPI001E741F66|nr:hypothetical protein NicSoilB8_00430 [Arthrobacter sp. NicSoilB8]
MADVAWDKLPAAGQQALAERAAPAEPGVGIQPVRRAGVPGLGSRAGAGAALGTPLRRLPAGGRVEVFKKYATFSGRASRSEYWWWALVSGLVSLVLNACTLVAGSAGATLRPDGTSVPGPGYVVGLILSVIISLAIIVPSLALSVRRLHDTNMSGWMYLLILIPLVGPIVIIILMATGSKPEGQRFDQPSWKARRLTGRRGGTPRRPVNLTGRA